MENLIFDSHAHYDDPSFDDDRDELLSGLRENGVGWVIDVSARMDDLPRVLELADKYDFIYASSGLHPTELADVDSGCMKDIEAALDNPKVVAVGEIGLDYHCEDTDKLLQKKWFEAQTELAKRRGYPIIIHSRDAAADTLDMVRATNARDAGGVVHCFSYEKEMARQYLDLGFYIGVGGVLTFKNSRKLKEVVSYMPMDRMLLETDCPYLAPVPHRGERNNSAMIKYVVSAISQLKNLDEEEIKGVTADNAFRMYRINQGT